jgi:quinol monooxygenase YgiN
MKEVVRMAVTIIFTLCFSATTAIGQSSEGTSEGSGAMVMTILEAQVAPERWDALRKSYDARARLPDSGAIVESFLVQGPDDGGTWRIVTVWRDQEALDAMRGSGETPTGVLIFRDAGAEPRLTVFTIWANPRAPLPEIEP